MSTIEKSTHRKDSGQRNRRVVKEYSAEIPSNSVVVGVLVGLTESQQPRVMFPGCGSGKGVTAQSTIRLQLIDLGRKLALLFEDGDVTKPIVIGRIEIPNQMQQDLPRVVEAQSDNDKLVLAADQEITLKCGKASITLTRHGKILLRGCYITSRSSGTNRIKGATVHIN